MLAMIETYRTGLMRMAGLAHGGRRNPLPRAG
jgi:hypothetical protein